MRWRCRYLLKMAVVAAFVASACSGSGGGDGDGSFVPGGTVRLAHFALGSARSFSAHAEFFSEYEVAPGEIPTLLQSSIVPLDECVITPLVGSSSGTPTYMEVGPTVTVRRGIAEMTLVMNTAGGTVRYASGAQDPETYVPHFEWDVEISGNGTIPAQSWLGELTSPQELLVTSPDMSTGFLDFAGSTPLTFTWNPTSAELTTIVFINSGEGGAFCRVVDDGSFTVPSEILMTLPDSGVLGVSLSTLDSHRLEGRDVRLSATTSVLSQYSRSDALGGVE